MLTRLLASLKGLLRRNAIDLELDEELQFHVEMETQKHIERGMSPGEARRVALRDLGGVTQTKEAVRDERGVFSDALARDLRFAFRSLRRSPAFTVVAVLTLTLVIGASTAIFSALYGLVFRRLGYTDPDRLVMLWDSNVKSGREHLPMMEAAFPTFERESRSFEGMAPYYPPSSRSEIFALKIWNTEERVSRGLCTHRLFSVLGVAPLLGRSFIPQDASAGSADVAILSYDFWRRHFGSRRDVVGQMLSLNFAGERTDYAIVGVMPEGFEFPFPMVPGRADVWLNLRFSLKRFLALNNFTVVARLRRGVTLEQAQAEIDTIASHIERSQPEHYQGERTSVVPLQSELIRDVRTVLWVLLAAVGSLFLIGCANLGHLLLARAAAREHDSALRVALGAGRAALVRASLAEVLVLVALGGPLGFLLAYGSMRTFLALLPPSLYVPRFESLALDWCLLIASTLVATGACTTFALLPALRVLCPDPSRLLQGRTGNDRRQRSVFRRPGGVLLVSELCLTLVLLTSTAMLARSLRALLATNLRFQPEHTLTLDVSFSNHAVGSLPDFDTLKVSLFREFADRVRALPGVRLVSVAGDGFPLPTYPNGFKADAGTGPIAENYQPAEMQIVSPNFIEILGARVVAGRWLSEQDGPGSQLVAVVNDTTARRYFPGSSPIGRRIAPYIVPTDKRESYLIVGVVEEADRFGKGERPQPAVYLSESQHPLNQRTFVVRTSGDPGALAGIVRPMAQQIYPGEIFVSDVRTGDTVVSEASARLRFASMLLSALAVVAVLLALVGVYGLAAYYTSQRTHEFGIRMALGATRGQVLRLVLRQGLSLAAVGLLLGSAIVPAFGHSMRAMLYHVAPVEPMTIAGVAALLLLFALLASWIPARRATTIDPVESLRHE